jgi:energy-coupling factor transport system permease protein
MVMIMQIIFRRSGDVYWQFWIIKITQGGVAYSFVVGFRLVNLILIAGLLFDVSTSEYLLAFKSWKIPYELSFLITTAIRFIPDYYSLFNKYKETFQIRRIYIGKLKFRDKINALVTILTTALITALNGVKQRAIALDMKGFRLYPTRTYLYCSNLTLTDILIQISVILLTITMIIIF